jgi:hypothetical protein
VQGDGAGKHIGGGRSMLLIFQGDLSAAAATEDNLGNKRTTRLSLSVPSLSRSHVSRLCSLYTSTARANERRSVTGD